MQMWTHEGRDSVPMPVFAATINALIGDHLHRRLP